MTPFELKVIFCGLFFGVPIALVLVSVQILVLLFIF